MHLFGGSAKKKQLPEFTGLQIQTAVNVLPIPLIYGCPRTSINIIYANGFLAVAQKSSGGKGLLSGGKSQTTGYKYFATFIGALGEGTVGAIRAIFDDQAVYTMATVPDGKIMILFDGTMGQAPWSYITSNWPADAFGYTDTAYVGFPNYPLDSSATIPQLNFLLDGHFQGTSPLNVFVAPDSTTFLMDADPALVVNDFLTDATHGVGFPTAFIDTSTLFTSANGFDPGVGDAALSTYCQAVGLAWSLVLNNTEVASSVLDRWFKNLVVAVVWTGSILKFIPYWDTFTGVNPGWDAGGGVGLKYFAPNTTPVFDLSDDDFQQTNQGEDPVEVTRIDVADVKNVVRLDWRDRYNLFNANVSEAKDEVSVDQFGPRVQAMTPADEFTHSNYAGASAQMQMQRNIAIRNTYAFKLDLQYCVLDPMDIVTLTDATLGLVKFPVRIRTIEEDEKGVLSIVAEEFPIGAATATAYPRQDNTPPTFAETNTVPGAVNTPAIFEPTSQMITAQGGSAPTVVVAASGGPSGVFDSNWGGCDVYLSNDGVTYVDYGTLSGPSNQGVLTATLPAYAGSNPDTMNTLSVDVGESNGVLGTVTAAQAAAGLSLCAIVDSNGDLELLAYTTATLTSPGNYNLVGLYRGFYGTVPCAHLSGSQFVRLDRPTLSIPLQPAFIGQTIYAKLPSFNVYGQAHQDLTSCTVYTYVPTGQGIDPTTNPVIAALILGNDVDLEVVSAPLIDLGAGGTACTPIAAVIDLGGV